MQRDPTTVEDLKDRIVRACHTINPQILCRVRSAILNRAIFFEREWKVVISSTYFGTSRV